MKFWGKILGAFFGFLLAGPFGLVIGLLIGHVFDRGIHLQWQNWPFHFGGEAAQSQQAFFNATFLVMGHLAKADGRVSEAEIQAARTVMHRMGLNEQQRKKAIELFEEGKKADFNLQQTLDELLQACHAKVLLRLFVELQAQTAAADGHLTPAKQRILQAICQQLGFAPLNFAYGNSAGYQNNYSYQQNYQQHSRQNTHGSATQLDEAYQTLGVSRSTNDIEIKKAYRRLMSQHHPDKLMSKGLPEEMVKLATEKTQKIQAAYERICTARGV